MVFLSHFSFFLLFQFVAHFVNCDTSSYEYATSYKHSAWLKLQLMHTFTWLAACE